MSQIYEWELHLTSVSPLHIGDDDRDILTDQRGYPFLPGTSIAGACRAFILKNYENGKEITNELFGNNQQQTERSTLLFSDGKCLETQDIEVRTGIAIDGKMKVAKDKHLFHRTFIQPGAVFHAKLKLHVTKEQSEHLLPVVEHVLQAINQGIIRFGAYKSIGGGKFQITTCHYVHYDCTNEDDLFAYVNRSKQSEKKDISAERRGDAIVEITIRGETETPLMIGGENVHDSSKPDQASIHTFHDGTYKPFIPASSLKGVLRHQADRITNVLGLSNQSKYITYLFGSSMDAEEKQIGALQLEDIVLNDSRSKVYTRISINPLTGGVKDGALIEEEVVTGTFETTWTVNDWQEAKETDQISLSLLLFTLRDLALQRTSLGSGASIGRGFIHIQEIILQTKDKKIIFQIDNQTIEDEDGLLTTLDETLQQVHG